MIDSGTLSLWAHKTCNTCCLVEACVPEYDYAAEIRQPPFGCLRTPAVSQRPTSLY